MATFHYTAGILARRRGDLELAREHGRAAVRLAVDAGMPLGEASFRLAAALAEPQDTAARELAVALRLASEGKCHHIESICRAALSLEAARGGDEDGIRQHLTAAVSSMSDSGLMQLLWFSPEEQAEICALALERGIQPVWASAFTRRWRLAPPDRPLAGGEWPCGTRIRALGGLAVERDAKPVGGRKAPKKVLELLRRLILRGKAGARVEHLAEALWPDADGDAAAHALETTVYRLRRLLGGPDTITLRDGRIALSASAVCVDAWELDEVLNRIEAARARRADADVGHLQDLARRRSCGPLFGDDDDPDATEARRRLEQRMARLVGEASQLSPSP